MKTLPEIVRDAMLLLDGGREYVVIVRGDHEPIDGRNHAFKIRLRLDTYLGISEYKGETSGWLGEQWSSWHERRGWLGGAAFDIDDVLASDWRIVS